MQRGVVGVTLVEVLIVVVILAIISMIVVPKLGSASDEARESALLTDVRTARRQVDLYMTQHAGRLPHLNEKGESDTANMVARLTKRTDVDGKLNPNGQMGPYLMEWPENPFSPSEVARNIKFANQPVPPRDNTSGWYCNTTTGVVSPNSSKGALSVDPG